ncbi:hypothetical protein R0K04_00850 [Pseudoalteromonas sp. SIMBA_153]
MKKVLVGLTLVLFSFSTFSSVTTTDKGAITKLFAYDDYGAVANRDGALFFKF